MVLKYRLLVLFLLMYTTVFSQCWQQVANGLNHVIAIKTDGSLWAWGYNNYVQLGDGTSVSKNEPIQIGDENDWQIVAAGENYNVALKTDGSLWTWGYNSQGQFGNGSIDNFSAQPIQIGSDTDWVSVSPGHDHCIAIKTDGTLWAWGANYAGQLGDGTTVTRTTPIQIGTSTSWQSLSAGYAHSLAVKNDGTLWAWGDNGLGQLGDGTIIDKSTPIQIAGHWSAISAGRKHSKAIKSDGTLWTWGSGQYGVHGDGTTNIIYSLPTLVNSDDDWKGIVTGYDSTVALKLDGSLWSWGDNNYGQLGNSNNSSNYTPVQINTSKTFMVISKGIGFHNLALTESHEIWSWGLNVFGQVGDQSNTNRNYPVNVPCSNLSAKEYTLSNADIRLYPIPASNSLTIASYDEFYFDRIAIYDLSGRLLIKINLNQPTQEIQLSEISKLPPGLYFSEVLFGEKRGKRMRFVKE